MAPAGAYGQLYYIRRAGPNTRGPGRAGRTVRPRQKAAGRPGGRPASLSIQERGGLHPRVARVLEIGRLRALVADVAEHGAQLAEEALHVVPDFLLLVRVGHEDQKHETAEHAQPEQDAAAFPGDVLGRVNRSADRVAGLAAHGADCPAHARSAALRG